MELQRHDHISVYVMDRAKEICPDVQWRVRSFIPSTGMRLTATTAGVSVEVPIDVANGIDAGIPLAVKEALNKLEVALSNEVASVVAVFERVRLLRSENEQKDIPNETI